jgi:hypothetical protein
MEGSLRGQGVVILSPPPEAHKNPDDVVERGV